VQRLSIGELRGDVIQPVPKPLHALGFDESKRDGEVDDSERLAGGPEGDVKGEG